MRRLWSVVVIGGCALTSKATPRELRYFAPELPTPTVATTAPCGKLQLGRVEADDALRLPIQRRVSAVELEPYETLRWTELPDVYARTAVMTELFVERPLEQVLSGAAPVLDLEVTAFEEVADAGGRAARVELSFVLHDDRRVLARGTIRKQQVATTPEIDAVVVAVGGALRAASGELAGRVMTAVCTVAPVGA